MGNQQQSSRMPSHEERMAPGDDDDDVDIIGYGEETAALVRNISLTYDTCIPFNRPVHLDRLAEVPAP